MSTAQITNTFSLPHLCSLIWTLEIMIMCSPPPPPVPPWTFYEARCEDPLLPSHGPITYPIRVYSRVVDRDWGQGGLHKLEETWNCFSCIYNIESTFWEWICEWARIQDGDSFLESKGSKAFRTCLCIQGWDAMDFTYLALATDGICTLDTRIQTDGPYMGQLCLSAPRIFSVSSLIVWVLMLEKVLAVWTAGGRASWCHSCRKAEVLECEGHYSAFASHSLYL